MTKPNDLRAGLKIGSMPSKLRCVENNGRSYRKQLEAAVIEKHGTICVEHAHLIDSAVTYEMHGQTCRWLIRNRFDSITPTELRTCSLSVATSKDRRNAAIARLGLLERTNGSALSEFYGDAVPDVEPDEPSDPVPASEPPETQDASDEPSGADTPPC